MYLFLEPNQTWVALPLTVTFLPSSVTVKLLYRSMMHLALLKNLIVISDWIRFSKNNQTHFSSVAGVHHTLRFPSESHCLNNHLGQPAEEEKTQVWSLPCLATPSLRALVEFRTNYWICPNWYMDFSKLLMILSKLIHGFLWVVTWIFKDATLNWLKLLHGFVICQSCSLYFSHFATRNQAEVWSRFQRLLKLLLWAKCVGWVKVLNTLGLLCLEQCFYCPQYPHPPRPPPIHPPAQHWSEKKSNKPIWRVSWYTSSGWHWTGGMGS